MAQKQHELLVKEFRCGSFRDRVLNTTDLLVRSLDMQQVSLVINYDLPTNRENYMSVMAIVSDAYYSSVLVLYFHRL